MSGKTKRWLPWLGTLIVMAAVFSTPVFSLNPEQRIKELEKKIAQLEQRIAKLEETILHLQKVQAKPAAASPDRWKDKASWRLLKKGMSKDDVERILGEPPTVLPNVHYGDIWFYPDSRGGNVSFNLENVLTSWNEI